MDSAQPAPQGQNPLVQEYYKTTEARKVEAKAQMDKLILALNSRRNMLFDPVAMRVAGAFLQPTKTGSFGESLGYAATAGAEEMEKKAARDAELAKMEFELGEKMRQQQGLDDQMKFRMKYFGGKPAAGAPAPAAAPAPVMPSLTAAPPFAAQELSDVPQRSTPEAPALLPQEMPQAAPPPAGALPPAGAYVPRQIDPMLSVIDPLLYKTEMEMDEAARKQAEFRLREREALSKDYMPLEIGGIKKQVYIPEYQAAMNAVEKGKLDVAEKFYTKYGFPFPYVKDKGVFRPRTAAEEAEDIEIAKGIETKPYPIPEVGGDVRLLPKQYRAYQRAVEEGKGEEWVDKNIRRKPAGGEAPKTEVKPFQTEEDRIVEQERRKRIAEERAKSEVKSRDEIIANAKTAMIIEKPANQIFKIASDPIRSKALGLLENPDVFSAVAGAAAEGVRAGPINIGIPAIRDAVAKVSGDPKEREKILNALQMLSRNYSEIELNFTRLYLKGEGAVTEGERAIVRQVSGGVGNRRTVALAQTETLLQRAAFDKAVKTELLRWEKANPNKSIDEFSESTGYKNLVKNLEQNTDAIYDKYFGEKKEPKAAEPKAAPQPASQAPAKANSISGWRQRLMESRQ